MVTNNGILVLWVMLKYITLIKNKIKYFNSCLPLIINRTSCASLRYLDHTPEATLMLQLTQYLLSRFTATDMRKFGFLWLFSAAEFKIIVGTSGITSENGINHWNMLRKNRQKVSNLKALVALFIYTLHVSIILIIADFQCQKTCHFIGEINRNNCVLCTLLYGICISANAKP